MPWFAGGAVLLQTALGHATIPRYLQINFSLYHMGEGASKRLLSDYNPWLFLLSLFSQVRGKGSSAKFAMTEF
jgi:hypothetical protein